MLGAVFSQLGSLQLGQFFELDEDDGTSSHLPGKISLIAASLVQSQAQNASISDEGAREVILGQSSVTGVSY